MCDEIICDAEAKSYDKKTKNILNNFNEKKEPSKTQNFICIFINCYSVIDSCYYLLLPDKI